MTTPGLASPPPRPVGLSTWGASIRLDLGGSPASLSCAPPSGSVPVPMRGPRYWVHPDAVRVARTHRPAPPRFVVRAHLFGRWRHRPDGNASQVRSGSVLGTMWPGRRVSNFLCACACRCRPPSGPSPAAACAANGARGSTAAYMLHDRKFGNFAAIGRETTIAVAIAISHDHQRICLREFRTLNPGASTVREAIGARHAGSLSSFRDAPSVGPAAGTTGCTASQRKRRHGDI